MMVRKIYRHILGPVLMRTGPKRTIEYSFAEIAQIIDQNLSVQEREEGNYL